MDNTYHESDDILKKLFEPRPIKVLETLEELFTARLQSLNIPKTSALSIMGMHSRTLDGILTGEQKMVDFTQLVKLSNFLGVNIDYVIKLFVQKMQTVHSFGELGNRLGETIDFINEKFNLAELKKIGVVNSLTDYDKIVKSICDYFGLKSIFDYREPNINVAFSAGKRAKINCSINNWVFLAEQTCAELRNPNKYSSDKLIEYFSNIRWQTMDVENGLVNVIKNLYQIGITVVFLPSFPSLHVRGATFAINDKPCIALTDYVGFYPTLWFSLIHELYHVLFDWEDILLSDFHISHGEGIGIDRESENEKEADKFARKYLFSEEKTHESSRFINNEELIRHFAISNNVDPSFVYVFHAFDAPKSDKYAWGRAKKKNPDYAVDRIKQRLSNQTNFSEHIKKLRNTIYN